MIVVSLLLILVSGGLLATGILQANDPFVMASIGVSVLAAAALFLGIRQQRGDVDRTVGHDDKTPVGRTAQPGAGRVTPAGAQAVRAPAASPPAQPVRPAGAAKVEPVAKPALKVDPVVRAATGSASVTAPPVPPPPVTPPPVAATPAEVTETQIIDADAVQPARTPPAAAQTAPASAPPPASVPATEPDEPDEPDEPAGLDDDEDPPDEPAAELLMASEVSRLAELDSEVLVVDGRPRYHLAGCPHLVDKETQPLPVSEAVELGFTACSLCGAATAVLTEASKT